MRAVPVVPAPSAIRAARVPAATRKCRFCSETIHAAERTCPHCGGVLFKVKPPETEMTAIGGFGMLTGLFIALVGLYAMFFKASPDQAGECFFMMVIGCAGAWVSYVGARRIKPQDA